ncbi:pyridoxal phosphate-dependent transferase [Boletus reticuloceps]|uniref:histidinol-phosphate transaminase n=1 Tax=Boletus reticuloceps TaxID=495285 RepID=A0A8I2YWE6_9AGAM|nr:pyridoxal phosphate-dependent transferase [Boletus reticuloceps]
MPILGLKPSSEPTKPAHFDIEKVIRPNILALHPYRCARDDYQEGILLDANENALGHSLEPSCQIPPELRDTLNARLNRYPDPSHDEIKTRIATLRGLPSEKHVFLGVGSDEVIDLIMRVCVTSRTGKDLDYPSDIWHVHGLCSGEGGERGRFSLPVDSVGLFSYPTQVRWIVVVDEAYIDFAGQEASAVSLINDYANLCVMQTLSKSFGLAAIRLGIALAQPPLIRVLSNAKAPYNISAPTAHLALAALEPAAIQGMRDKIRTLLASRDKLKASLESLADLGVGKSIGGNDANFLVIPILDPTTGAPDNSRSARVYKTLAEEKGGDESWVVVRYRGGEPGCEGCLRMTVGSEEENAMLLKRLARVLAS